MPENLKNQLEVQATIDALRREAEDVPEMSLDEINAEIAAARAERKAKISAAASDEKTDAE